MVEYPVLGVNRDYQTAPVTMTMRVPAQAPESLEYCVQVSCRNSNIRVMTKVFEVTLAKRIDSDFDITTFEHHHQGMEEDDRGEQYIGHPDVDGEECVKQNSEN